MGYPDVAALKRDEIVLARGCDNELAECRLVEVQAVVAPVCSEKEWQLAKKEGREPDCLGWQLASV